MASTVEQKDIADETDAEDRTDNKMSDKLGNQEKLEANEQVLQDE